MDVVTEVIWEFKHITGIDPSKYNLDFICGFMVAYMLSQMNILYCDPTPEQLEMIRKVWPKV